jgi:NAD(P)-dependent dehydrogenase (short-subunit alcohol dehydrogenase family)
MNVATPVALVTGGGTGIGKMSGLALARAGYHVVLSGRRRAALEAAASEGATQGINMSVVPADVSDRASVEALFANVEQSFGRLDLLFNNAGTGAPAVPIDRLTFEQWSVVVATNVTGTFLCTQQAFRLMKAQRPRGGRIINNGSLSAYVPRPNSAAYSASKHAITGLTRSTSLDGRQYDIACGQIDVGNAATEIAAQVSAGIEQPNGAIVCEPTIDPDNVAQAVAFMASLPIDTNVLFLTIMASKMPFVGRG